MSPLTIISGVLSVAMVWSVYSAFCLLRNYLIARKIGLPTRVIPISHTNPLWMLVDRKILNLVKRLPFGDNNFTRYNYRAWEIDDRCQSHHELGDAFVLVTPGRNWLYISNPDTLMEVFRRRVDFPRCIELTGMSDPLIEPRGCETS